MELVSSSLIVSRQTWHRDLIKQGRSRDSYTISSRGQFSKETTSVVFLQLQRAHVDFRLITD